MSKMNYFRRPHLVGTALRRPPTPSIRGNKRRNNADQNQALPYFSGLPANGGTLEIETVSPADGSIITVEASVSASTTGIVAFSQALLDLNGPAFEEAALVAFDADGCIGVRSSQISSSSNIYLRVVGGSAATALGFNISEQDFFAAGGDQPSAPEGRIGNAYDTALMVPGESVTSETLTRVFGRVMSNTDVLYSELMRDEIVYKKIGSTPGPATVLDLGIIAPDQKVFVDGGPSGFGAGEILNASSSPTTLTRFFFLVDESTGKQSRSAVTAVAHADGTQALGAEKQVLVTDILEIPNGRVVRIGSSSGVRVGDYARITGSSTKSWSNNGYRWIVEEILDPAHVALRPMSAQELARVGEIVHEHHPYVELSTVKESGGSYGTLTVYRGPFSVGVKLTISPPIVSGQTVDIWAAVPANYRNRPVDWLSAPSFMPYTPFVTVGTSGDFPDLVTALAWVATSPGADTIELVLLENQVAPAGGYTVSQSINIRGATPDIQIGFSGGFYFAATPANVVIELSNVRLIPTNPIAPSGTQVVLSNLRTPDGSVRRTLDTAGSNVDIGAGATGVDIGKSGAVTTVRGTLYAAGYIQAGGVNGVPGVRATFDGEKGYLTLAKIGEQDVALTKDHVDILTGGTGSDAKSLHTHADLSLAISEEAGIRSQADIDLSDAIAEEHRLWGVADTGLQGQINGKAPTIHTHAISDVSELQTTLDGKAPTHDHPYSLNTHGHEISGISGLQGALDGKAPTHSHPYASDTHGHEISGISGLQGALDGKAPTHEHPYAASDHTHTTGAHNHSISEVTGLQNALDGKAPTHSHPYAASDHTHTFPSVGNATVTGAAKCDSAGNLISGTAGVTASGGVVTFPSATTWVAMSVNQADNGYAWFFWNKAVPSGDGVSFVCSAGYMWHDPNQGDAPVFINLPFTIVGFN